MFNKLYVKQVVIFWLTLFLLCLLTFGSNLYFIATSGDFYKELPPLIKYGILLIVFILALVHLLCVFVKRRKFKINDFIPIHKETINVEKTAPIDIIRLANELKIKNVKIEHVENCEILKGSFFSPFTLRAEKIVLSFCNSSSLTVISYSAFPFLFDYGSNYNNVKKILSNPLAELI